MFFPLQDLVMDILRVLGTPDLEVRKKTLQLALDLVSSRNVEEVRPGCREDGKPLWTGSASVAKGVPSPRSW